MKNNYFTLLLFLLFFKATTGFGAQHTITSVVVNIYYFAFSPDSISAEVGDTIIFSLNSAHFPQEVSQETWNANDSTSLPGGFKLPYGGGTIVVNEAKTYYYVCGVHYYQGMKGRIFVTNPNGIKVSHNPTAHVEVYPNPVSSNALINTGSPLGKQTEVKIFNLAGKCLYQEEDYDGSQSLDLSGFCQGVYLVSIKCDDVYLEKKIIVSR